MKRWRIHRDNIVSFRPSSHPQCCGIVKFTCISISSYRRLERIKRHKGPELSVC